MVVLTKSTKDYNYKYLRLFEDLDAAVKCVDRIISEENHFLVSIKKDEETVSLYISNGVCYDIFYDEGVSV